MATAERETTISVLVPHHQYLEASRFYEDGFGLALDDVSDGNGIHRFLVGNWAIRLVPISGPLVDTNTGITLHVHRLHDFVSYLVVDGYLPPDILSGLDYTTSKLEVCDPAGNRLTLLQETH
jgi:hypothetical protein